MTLPQDSLAARDIARVLHPYTDLRLHEERGPIVIAEGKGVRVRDVNGREYIEGLAGLWCVSLGWGEQRLVEAAARQMEKLAYIQTFSHRSSEPVIELAEKLVSMAPRPLARAMFLSSGSEAVDTAIKLTWYYFNARGLPQKKRILARRRAYHGVTVAAGHLTGLAYARVGFDLPIADRFYHLTPPTHYREGLLGESEQDFVERLVRELETTILVLGPDTVAAFIAEPVMGAGGVIVPPQDYFPRIQQVLRRYDVLMIADEVICGFGRTGNAWGSETFGIEPDLLTCAKQLSSGYVPIAALLISEEIYEVIADYSHQHGMLGMGYTFGGHPVAAAVALRTLEIYEEDQVFAHVREVTPRFQSRLRALADHPLVGEARGVGLIGGIELVADRTSRRQYDPKVKAASRVVEACQRHGLLLRPLAGDVIGLCPPLVIRESEIDEMFDRLERALDDVAVELQGQMAVGAAH